MLSIKTIRNETDQVKKSIADRGLTGNIDRIIELDVRRREIIAETDSLRARRNEVSGSLGRSKEKPLKLIAEMREVGSRIKQLEGDLRNVVGEYDALLLDVPNIPEEPTCPWETTTPTTSSSKRLARRRTSHSTRSPTGS